MTLVRGPDTIMPSSYNWHILAPFNPRKSGQGPVRLSARCKRVSPHLDCPGKQSSESKSSGPPLPWWETQQSLSEATDYDQLQPPAPGDPVKALRISMSSRLRQPSFLVPLSVSTARTLFQVGATNAPRKALVRRVGVATLRTSASARFNKRGIMFSQYSSGSIDAASDSISTQHPPSRSRWSLGVHQVSAGRGVIARVGDGATSPVTPSFVISSTSTATVATHGQKSGGQFTQFSPPPPQGWLVLGLQWQIPVKWRATDDAGDESGCAVKLYSADRPVRAMGINRRVTGLNPPAFPPALTAALSIPSSHRPPCLNRLLIAGIYRHHICKLDIAGVFDGGLPGPGTRLSFRKETRWIWMETCQRKRSFHVGQKRYSSVAKEETYSIIPLRSCFLPLFCHSLHRLSKFERHRYTVFLWIPIGKARERFPQGGVTRGLWMRDVQNCCFGAERLWGSTAEVLAGASDGERDVVREVVDCRDRLVRFLLGSTWFAVELIAGPSALIEPVLHTLVIVDGTFVAIIGIPDWLIQGCPTAATSSIFPVS
ncbi:uncharacterized protein CLUP02_02225 [Colletotrichum lupini]|uniref:Uncharacterized protein n=1 Tax=Colletotrichum lupini TaxID=145971 RepID=A0A9Q8SDV1_9PEZI|nr:uncharacterized protein CLUP02_02225 [Colletotrichum lupini]UQC75571.1 hypothetical protein CLUP02_02225 [Colletotrichum lupini]